MPYPRYRIYTCFNSYWWFFRDLLLGRLKKGNDVEILERKLAEKFKVSEVVCIPMARVGIYLALKNLIKPGQGVIMSPYTIADVVNMVVCAGGRPVFADIEQRSCNINPDEVAKLIDQNTGAVIVTHLHGVGARVYEILDICRRHNLPLIEDAAQAFGGRAKGKRLGTIGDIGIFSLGMYKNINSWYGGVVVAKDSVLLGKIKAELSQRDYQTSVFIFKKILKGLLTGILTYPLIFRPLTYWIFRFGFLRDIEWINRQVEIELDLELKKEMPSDYLARYTPFQARLTLAQLDRIDAEIEIRNRKAALYRDGLKNISELVLPPEENDSKYIYPVFAVQYQDKKKLLKWLMKHKRDVAAQHLKNCADLPAFAEFYRDCPVARKTANEVILLPTYTRYPDSEVKKNIAVIRAFIEKQ